MRGIAILYLGVRFELRHRRRHVADLAREVLLLEHRASASSRLEVSTKAVDLTSHLQYQGWVARAELGKILL